MKRIDILEFSDNLDQYIDLCLNEDIYITKNGEAVAVLSNPNSDFERSLFRLYGCLKDYDTHEDYDEIIGNGIIDKYKAN